MYESCDQTHNQNERRVEKDWITETPGNAGQHFIIMKPL